MKITLTLESTEAVKKLLECIKTHNEFASKRFSPLINAILIDVYKHQDSSQLERIANGIISPKTRKKALLKRLEKIAEQFGEESVERLERSAKRLKKFTTSNPENAA